MIEMPRSELASLLGYDPETGRLFWHRRPDHLFPSNSRQSQAQCAHNWNARYAGKEAGNVTTRGYIQVGIFRKLYKAHRVAWCLHYGTWPSENIDHVNGDGTDNRILNLRDVPQQINAKNLVLSKANTSGTCGVHFRRSSGRWLASITVDRTQKHIGSFATREEAIEARRAAERRSGFHPHHGSTPVPKKSPKRRASD